MTENNNEHNNEELRIGVYICHCGSNIGGVIAVSYTHLTLPTN